MAINDPNTSADDPTRGTGPDKVTQIVEPNFEAPPDAQASEPSDSSVADPARGGCMRFGWGCLPVMASLLLVPANLLF